MASYVTPKKNTEYIFYVSLASQANTKVFQANPTLAAGDVKVSTDGGAEANITTLPVVTPAGSKRVKVTLSAAEMNGDNVQVTFSDAAGDEWCDLTVNIQTSARQIDDLAYPTTSGRSLDVSATGEIESNVTQIAGSAVSTSTAQLGVNVVNFGGSAGAFAAGRPEVNASHIAGSAVSTSAAQIGVNVVNAGGTAWASGSLTSGVFATGAITAGAIAADAIGASELAADAVAEIQSGLSTLTAADIQTALVNAGLVLNSTTIATLASQTSFTLTDGSADNDAYNGCVIVITDASTATQKAVGVVLDYTGATKTVTLANDPAVFTMAASDLVDIIPCRALKPTVDTRTLDVTATGAAGVDWGNVENPTTTVNLSATSVKTATDVETDTADIQSRIPAALVGGRIDASVGAMASNTLTSAALAADAVAEIQSGLATAASLTTVEGKVDAILVDTAEIGAAGAGLTAIPWNAAWDAEVESEANDALVALNLDHLVKNAVDTNFATTVHLDSVIGQLADNGTTATFDRTTDSLEATRDRGDAAWTTATGFSTHSAADVWSVATRTLTAATNITSTGGTITVSSGSVSVYDFTTAAKALIQTEAEDALVTHRLDELLNADSDIDGLSPPVVGSVFHELLSKTAGSFTYDQTTDSLEALRDRGDVAWTTATGFSTLTAADVRTAVGLAAANLDTQLSGIQSDTNDIQTRIPAALVSGRIDASVGAMATDVITSTSLAASAVTEIQSGLATSAEIGVAGAGLSAIPWNVAWDAEVQSEVQDAIEANHLDHLLASAYDPALKPGAADALLNELIESDAGVSRFTANALEQAPSGSGASASAIADAVWKEAIADHSGTTGSVAESLSTRQPTIWDTASSTVNLSGTTVGGIAGTLQTFDAIWAKIKKWLQLGFRSDAAIATDNATELAEINANGGSGAGDFDNAEQSLEAIATELHEHDTGAGSGARTVTVTVQTSGAVAIQNAKVRMTLSGSTYVQTTNGSGQCTFNLDDGTWTVAITAVGYSFAGTTLVVDGTETPTYTMTTNQPAAPADPTLSTGSVLCVDTNGDPQESVIIYTRMTTAPTTDGYAYSARTFTMTSGADGVASHAGFVRTAGYRSKRGKDGKESDEYTVPDAANFSLPEILGQP